MQEFIKHTTNLPFRLEQTEKEKEIIVNALLGMQKSHKDLKFIFNFCQRTVELNYEFTIFSFHE